MVSDLAHKVGATVIVDNIMASPILQKPLQLGADVIMYSATKHMDGQGRVLAGAILGSFAYIHEHLLVLLRREACKMKIQGIDRLVSFNNYYLSFFLKAIT